MKGSITELAAERFPHGSRSRYVKGCRCASCRESNRLYYHQRQAVQRQRLVEFEERDREAGAVLGPAATVPAPQVWIAPDGTMQVRLYLRACPGLNGPCPTRSHLRKDSKGGICGGCRARLAFNGIVSAEPARLHLLALRKEGIGRRAVVAACDVAGSALIEIASGRQVQIRAATERRILAVDTGARADASSVKASSTWAAIGELRKIGWTKTRIARGLGMKSPALQLKERRVLARNALAVAQLLTKAKLEHQAAKAAKVEAKLRTKLEMRRLRQLCPRCHVSHRDDPIAAGWCATNPNAPLELQEAS